MKQQVFNVSLFMAVVFIVSACAGTTGEKAATGDAKKVGEVSGELFKADSTLSVVEWEGSKPAGKHYGTINIKSGEIYVKNGTITGGRIVIDMHSIANLDLEDPEYNLKLVNHLKSPDFFAVDSFPEAYFTLTSVKALEQEEQMPKGETLTHEVSGNLKIKNIEKGISFKARIEVNGDIVSASAPQFVIDRSEWKIKYGSRKFFDNLKDKFIYDEIGLKFTFVARK